MPLYLFYTMVQKIKNDQKLKSRGSFLKLRPAGGNPGLDHLQKYFFARFCFLDWTWPF